MSLYAEYVKERTNDHMIEEEYGFITYRYLNDDQVYIIDLFVAQEYRKQKRGVKLADTVCSYARNRGCKEMIGTVVPSCKNATESLKSLLSYGMKIDSASDNLIVLKKDL